MAVRMSCSFFLMLRRPPRSTRTDTLCPYTTLVRSESFNALRRELAPELTLAHAVREDLLSAAEKAGLVTPALDMKTQEALFGLADGGARVVVCTCSTLGASAEAAADESDVPILRIDRAMADLAVPTGQRIGVCACLPARSEERRVGKECVSP